VDNHADLNRRATAAAVAVSATLSVAKLGAWIMTGSVAVLGSLVDSLLDLGASGVSFIAVRRASVPADEDHGFGHGKAEPLAALAQAAFLAGSALFVAFEAAPRLFDPPAVSRPSVGVAVMLLGIVATIPLVLFQRYAARRTGSVAVEADAAHYTADVLGHAAVAVSLVLSTNPELRIVDPLLGLLVAGYVARQAVGIIRRSVDMLMDHELPDALRAAILDVVQGHPEVRSVGRLRTRESGPQRFVDLVVKLDPGTPLHEAHRVLGEITDRVGEAAPRVEVTVRAEPD